MRAPFTATDWVTHLNLMAHPEGGYYREVYRASESYPQAHLPARFSGNRNFSTSIYFLMEKNNFSAFHRIQSDETWHFYAGQALEVLMIHPDGNLEVVILGANPVAGHYLQYTVPHGVWFASRVLHGEGYALVGCTVAPGFDFNDFEMADSKVLSQAFPAHRILIGQLTR